MLKLPAGATVKPRVPCSAQLPLRRWSPRVTRRWSGCCRRALPDPYEDAEQHQARAQGREPAQGIGYLEELDLNQLQTALNTAIAGDNFELAAKIRDVLQLVAGGGDAAAATAADWRRLGVLDWLADRAEHLGFRLPTGACI